MTDDGTHDARGVQQEPAPLAAAVPQARQPPCRPKAYASNRGAPMWGLARGTAAYDVSPPLPADGNTGGPARMATGEGPP
jgi:hypothetical protein